MRYVKLIFLGVLTSGMLVFFLPQRTLQAQDAGAPSAANPQLNEDYQQYLAFFEEVFKKMQQEYYYPVTVEDFKKFLYIFNTKIYNQLRGEGKTSNYVKWRSAAFLVDALKAPEDVFSRFYPPTVAKEFETTVLGKKIDLGIEGKVTPGGYLVNRVQIRSDAYAKGLRARDVIVKIGERPVDTLTQKEADDLLVPDEGAQIALRYRDHKDLGLKTIEVTSQEYFKQFVFMLPTKVPDVYCIQIQKFNRMTGEDLERYMNVLLSKKRASLIIDLRGNPGGPPLAARAISGFFLKPNEEFAYFQRRGRPKAWLHVPPFPPEYHFSGDMVILVDAASGSASELFSGVLQHHDRAVIMGQNTAGQVFLKSMFYFDDDSMVALVTGRGFQSDDTVFEYDGVTPDQKIEDSEMDLINYAAEYLAAKRQ